ncbi:DNA primase, small subunit [Mycolicibacterium fortuitum]|uniref:DNA primase, small subunit n=1 Tax=Mycolicibacterium fortuitum TaxID=1766 RepID=A0A378UZZ4_MYCFO|nr:DNA primase, small subunit [Mycolicibacterium fortuitum]
MAEKAGGATELDVDGIKVRFTNPDKVYYPKLGKDGTKGKLMEYYLSVADRMVTLLKDRPTHLQRFPTVSRVKRSTRSGCRRSIPTILRRASSRSRPAEQQTRSR